MTADALPSLNGPRLTLRPATAEDLAAIRAVLDDPSVAPWWPMTDRLHEELFGGSTHSFVILADGQTAGVILFEEETDPDYRFASIDLALGAGFQDRGLGVEAVATMAAAQRLTAPTASVFRLNSPFSALSGSEPSSGNMPS